MVSPIRSSVSLPVYATPPLRSLHRLATIDSAMSDPVVNLESKVGELRAAVLSLQHTSTKSFITMDALSTRVAQLAASLDRKPETIIDRFRREIPEYSGQIAHKVFNEMPHSGGPVQSVPLHQHLAQHRDSALSESDACVEALFRLRQTGSLPAYIAEFYRLATRASTVSSDPLLCSFIGGLRWDIKSDVRKYKPETTEAAIALAVQFEQKQMTPSLDQTPNSDVFTDDTRPTLIAGVVDTVQLSAPECSVKVVHQVFDEMPSPNKGVHLDSDSPKFWCLNAGNYDATSVCQDKSTSINNIAELPDERYARLDEIDEKDLDGISEIDEGHAFFVGGVETIQFAATSEDILCKVGRVYEFQEGYHRGVRDKGGTLLHLEIENMLSPIRTCAFDQLNGMILEASKEVTYEMRNEKPGDAEDFSGIEILEAVACKNSLEQTIASTSSTANYCINNSLEESTASLKSVQSSLNDIQHEDKMESFCNGVKRNPREENNEAAARSISSEDDNGSMDNMDNKQREKLQVPEAHEKLVDEDGKNDITRKVQPLADNEEQGLNVSTEIERCHGKCIPIHAGKGAKAFSGNATVDACTDHSQCFGLINITATTHLSEVSIIIPTLGYATETEGKASQGRSDRISDVFLGFQAISFVSAYQRGIIDKGGTPSQYNLPMHKSDGYVFECLNWDMQTEYEITLNENSEMEEVSNASASSDSLSQGVVSMEQSGLCGLNVQGYSRREIEVMKDEIEVKKQIFGSYELLSSKEKEKRALIDKTLSALKYSISSFEMTLMYFEQREARARARIVASLSYLDKKRAELGCIQTQISAAQGKLQQSEVELKNNLVLLKSKLEEENRRLGNEQVLFAIDNVEKIGPAQKKWCLAAKATELLKFEEEKTKLQSEMKLSREKLGVMRRELEDLNRKLVKVEREMLVVQGKVVAEMEHALQNVVQEKETLLVVRDIGKAKLGSSILDECIKWSTIMG